MGNRRDDGFSTVFGDDESSPGGDDSSGRGAKSGSSGAGLSLKARAVAYLSRREHSRQELRRKLSAWCDDPAAVEAVLDDLAREHWQSDQRYAQAYAHRVAARQGTQRILGALRQQGLADEQLADLKDGLRASEAGRARAVWQRKFGQAPADPREYARQYRFMAGRGFSVDCIRRLLSSRESFDPADSAAEDEQD
ncbi:MAG: recombination regulator RecX [Castellaniella sp.]